MGKKPNSEGRELAHKVFTRWLIGHPLSRKPDFDRLMAEHPDLKEELRRIHEEFEAGQFVIGPDTVNELVQSHHCDFDTTTVLLEEEVDGKVWPTNVDLVKDDLKRYIVQNEVARGGMGIIYRVRDKELNRPLAMKVMAGAPTQSSDGSTPHVLSRFLEEAQVTAQLDHPGIVSVHELGIDAAGRPFFTMKLVKGREFSRIVEFVRNQQEGWNLSRAVGAMVKVCQTIAYAHAKKVIHRDLKPGNIMVGRFGEVYVMDWGLAKVVGRADLHDIRIAPASQVVVSGIQTSRNSGASNSADSPLITMDGTVVGTPAFMAPEQARGDVVAVDYLSDIYSLGAVLYHLLTGQSPYVERGSRISPRTILARVLDGPPKSVLNLEPNAPVELVAICEKAMARKKKNRYPSSEAFAEDLQAWLDRRVVRAYQTGPAAELRSWVARNRLVSLVAAIAVMALLVISGGWAYMERVDAQQFRSRLAKQYLRQGQALCEDGRIDQGLHLFVLAAEACPSSSGALSNDIQLNLLAWMQRCNRLVQVIDHESELASPGFGSSPMAVAFSPDGIRLISGGWHDLACRIWSVETGLPVGKPMEHGDSVRSIFLTQDGNHIITRSRDKVVHRWSGFGDAIGDPIPNVSRMAFNQPNSLFSTASDSGVVSVWSAASGEQMGQPKPGRGEVTAMEISADGQVVLVGYSDESIRAWSIESGELLVDSKQVHLGGTVRAFSPDGKSMVIVDDQGTGRLWSIDKLEPRGFELRHETNIQLVGFAPDGSLVATGTRGGDSPVKIWSAQDGLPKARIDEDGEVNSLTFSPDGGLLLPVRSSLGTRIWSTQTGDQIGLEIAMRGAVRADSVAFSADNNMIAVAASGIVKVWTVGIQPKPKSTFETSSIIREIDFSSDGGKVLLAGNNGISIWSKHEATPLVRFKHPARVWTARFGPNDNTVIAPSSDSPGTIHVLSLEGRELTSLNHDGAQDRCIAYSPDGTLVAAGSFDGNARLWDLSSKRILAVLKHPQIVEDLVFSKDGKSLITACGDGGVRIWSLKDRVEVLPRLNHDDAILAIRQSPDGKLLATAGRNQVVQLWELDSRTPIGTTFSQNRPIEHLDFSPDGRYLATACMDGHAQVWSIKTGEKIGPPFPHETGVWAVKFDPNENQLVTGSAGAKTWAIPNPQADAVANPRLWVQSMVGTRIEGPGVTSRLTPTEWRMIKRSVSQVNRLEPGWQGNAFTD